MRNLSARTRDNIIAMQFYLPSMLVIIVFILYPIVKSMIMSVTDWYLLSGRATHPFVGFLNFANVLGNTGFWKIVNATLIYTIVGVAGKMYVGLGTAVLLNKKFVGRSVVRGLMIIPWAMPTVVVCTVFMVSLDPAYGIFNWALVKLGIVAAPVSFFSRPWLALAVVTFIGIWKYFPFTTLMLLAAMQGISKEYYNAASIDGAGAWKQFRYITWPLLLPVWMIVLILQILWTVKEFELVYLITSGGPDNWTSIIGVDVYLNAFRFYKVGEASAEGMFLLAFSIIMSVVYFLLSRRTEPV
jgi:multiple sugar transport system permease protein